MTNRELRGYNEWLVNLKHEIRSVQIRAVTAVDSELTVLYWQIGRDIIERQERQGWGANVVGQLAADLVRKFSDMKGWSRSNLMAMRAFAQARPDEAIVRQLVGQLPWGHNLKLLSGLKSHVEREWYARAAQSLPIPAAATISVFRQNRALMLSSTAINASSTWVLRRPGMAS